jgi:RNase P/RNase MRP subunit POP5
MDAKSLLQMIRHAVSELFGDYGSGMTSASLQGKPSILNIFEVLALNFDSQ